MTFTNEFDYMYFSEVRFHQIDDRKFIVLDHNDTYTAQEFMCVYFYLNDHIHLMRFTSF